MVLIHAALIANFMQEKDDYVSTAIAYQIAFDLYDNGTQEFLAKVIKSLPAKIKEVSAEKENRESSAPGIYISWLTDESNGIRSIVRRIERSRRCTSTN